MALHVKIKWKNGYTWQTEFEGEIDYYLIKKGIKRRKFTSKNGARRESFTIPVGSSDVKYVTTEPSFEGLNALKAAQLYLTALGDTATITSRFGKKQIN